MILRLLQGQSPGFFRLTSKSILTAGLIISSSLVLASCRRGDEYGFLVAGFSDSPFLFKKKIVLPTREDGFQFNYELRQGEIICSLTGQLNLKKNSIYSENCEDFKGVGKIACNNNRSLKLRWSPTSCQGGFGQSIKKKGPQFFFGFERNKERALDEFEKAQVTN